MVYNFLLGGEALILNFFFWKPTIFNLTHLIPWSWWHGCQHRLMKKRETVLKTAGSTLLHSTCCSMGSYCAVCSHWSWMHTLENVKSLLTTEKFNASRKKTSKKLYFLPESGNAGGPSCYGFSRMAQTDH